MVKASWCARLATLALYTSTSALSYQDTISANNLIGDYFGIPSFNQTFDYVIIGGGTAGLTLASRLSRNGSFSVAVVEAGDFYEFSNGNQTSIPGYAATLTGTAPVHRNPLIDWGYQTEYDEVSVALDDHDLHLRAFNDFEAGSWPEYFLQLRENFWRWECS